MTDDLHRQDDTWDAAMDELPAMYCGRLDMGTYNAATGVRQHMVYFDGDNDCVVCEGPRADYVAYAANRYQPMKAEIQRLSKRVETLEKRVKAVIEAWRAWDGFWWKDYDACCEAIRELEQGVTAELEQEESE